MYFFLLQGQGGHDHPLPPKECRVQLSDSRNEDANVKKKNYIVNSALKQCK